MDLTSFFLVVSYIVLLGAAYSAGTHHLLARLLRWVRSITMPSNPNGPRPVGREVKAKLKEAELEMGVIENYLEPRVKTDHGAAIASRSMWKIKALFGWIFNLGVDKSDNGHTNGNGEE